jgi:hypothetical protein
MGCRWEHGRRGGSRRQVPRGEDRATGGILDDGGGLRRGGRARATVEEAGANGVTPGRSPRPVAPAPCKVAVTVSWVAPRRRDPCLTAPVLKETAPTRGAGPRPRRVGWRWPPGHG